MANAENKAIDRNLTIVKEALRLNLMFSRALNNEKDSDFYSLQTIVSNGIDNILEDMELPTDDNTTNAFYDYMQVFNNSRFIVQSNSYLENRIIKFKNNYSNKVPM